MGCLCVRSFGSKRNVKVSGLELPTAYQTRRLSTVTYEGDKADGLEQVCNFS